MKFTARQVFNCDVDTFWNKIFFDPEYNKTLFLEGLGFKGCEILELTGEPGTARKRVMKTEPKAEAPAVVTKLIGGNFTYTETGTFDPATKVWTYEIVTSQMADKVKTKGRFYLQPTGEKQCERINEVELNVSIFGVGGVIEKFIEGQTQDSSRKTAEFTNQWIAKKGL